MGRLVLEHLSLAYAQRSGAFLALADVDLAIQDGEFVTIVGPSGCGKSTLLRMIAGLEDITSGEIRIDGRVVNELDPKDRDVAMVFQDYALYPHMTVFENMAFSLRYRGVARAEIRRRVDHAARILDIDPLVARMPRQLSGGQRQRVAIARALAVEPAVLVLDEAVAALDVSVQAQILNLLEEMKTRYGLTLIFIAHDLAVVKNVSDRVVVMYLGKICEVGSPDIIYQQPAHPYTRVLLDAIPVPDPSIRPEARAKVIGEIPSPVAPPSGCRFRTRCPKAQAKCADEEPQIREFQPGQFVACHFPLAPGETLPTRNGSAPLPA